MLNALLVPGTWQAYNHFWMLKEQRDNMTVSISKTMQTQQPGQIQPRLQQLQEESHVAEPGQPRGAGGTSQPPGKKREEKGCGEGQGCLKQEGTPQQ